MTSLAGAKITSHTPLLSHHPTLYYYNYITSTEKYQILEKQVDLIELDIINLDLFSPLKINHT